MPDLLYLINNSLLISLISFGGGAQALFYQTMVIQKHLISSTDLSAMLAFGYATPGPVIFGTATFVGYRIAGIPGAIIGSISIFIMPFILALLSARYIGHLLEHPHAKLFVKGVGLAAAGIIAATAVNIVHPIGFNAWHLSLTLVSFVVMLRWQKLNPFIILLAGGALGLIFS